MKNNMFMALTTSSLNALALVVGSLIDNPKFDDALLSIMSLLSPFLAIFLLRFYIKIDHPPELIRQISSLEASIAVCRTHLKDNDASEEFRRKTRKQLESFQIQLQNVRSKFETDRTHTVTPFDGSPD